ncbi:MAG: hypothetical protein ACK4FJ_16950 [Ferrovibrio sp.]|uniref:hypothetical protein n=1 Tax=Ferrovibrio sp. TaxID=1917215 RepID=UPI00391CCA2B
MNKECFTCAIVAEYVDLANGYTQELSTALVSAMQTAFLAYIGIWVIVHGYRMILLKATVSDLGKESIYVFISALLLFGSGPGLVNVIFIAALKMMGAAAATALLVANKNIDGAPEPSTETLGAGMTELVRVAEDGVVSVIQMAFKIATTVGWTNWLPVLFAIVLIVPYFLVLIVYFSQVVVSIFRITMLATLSPFMMLGFGFGWGREIATKGIRTVISSFMVLFGSTLALGVMLYGVTRLGLDDMPLDQAADFARINNAKFVVAVALGWLGTAFMTEATSIANSITGSQLTNQAAAIITTGAAATGAAMFKFGRQGLSMIPNIGMNSQTGELKFNGQSIGDHVQALLQKATKQTPKP